MKILSCRKPHARSRQTLRAWGFFNLNHNFSVRVRRLKQSQNSLEESKND